MSSTAKDPGDRGHATDADRDHDDRDRDHDRDRDQRDQHLDPEPIESEPLEAERPAAGVEDVIEFFDREPPEKPVTDADAQPPFG